MFTTYMPRSNRARALPFVCVALLLSAVCAAAESQQFSDWIVSPAPDGTAASALTVINDEAGFGEWCFTASKSCTWELLINISCQVGEDHLMFANSTDSYASLKTHCLGKSELGSLYVYAFNWKDIEGLIKSPTKVSLVAFAIPLKNSQFRVVRFSLNGLREATGLLERRFFKGAQPASISDQTL